MPGFTIHQLDITTAGHWSFQDSSLTWKHPTLGVGGRFDPFPAYPHDAGLAADAAERVAELCPPLYDIEIYLPNREETGRTNGYSTNHLPRRYVDGDWVTDPPVGLIVMSAKRIPPHPAMTRYLVGHEYGHHIAWMLGKLRGASHIQDTSWLTQYGELRRLPESAPLYGSGGNWHAAVEEIFACDFRVWLGIETEYWPHPGIPHPADVGSPTGDFRAWWIDALDQLRAAESIR